MTVMRILLDASCLFDPVNRPGSIPESGYPVLASPSKRFFVSAVSIWDMRLKYRSGFPRSRFSPEEEVDVLEDREVAFLPMDRALCRTYCDRIESYADYLTGQGVIRRSDPVSP